MRLSPYFTASAFLFRFLTFTQGLPTNKFATAGHFTVEQKGVNTYKSNWPPSELWRGLRKHHRPLQPAVSRMTMNGGHTVNGTVKATPDEYDTEFVNEITVGNDTLFVDIDTGSSDFWIFSSQLPEKSQQNHRIYHPEVTGTKIPKHIWDITYNDGTGAAGNVFLDKVSLSGLEVPSQAVEAATWVSYEFADQEVTDGIMGFGFDSFNTVTPKKQKTWFSNIMEQLERPLFTACLKHRAPGFYDFGFIDENKHVGKLSYLPVDTSRGRWETTFSGFSTGKVDNSTYRFKAVVDTGTTFMLLPKQITEQYYSSIANSAYDRENGGWTFPCNATLPDFAIHINDYKAIVPGKHINWAQIPGADICFGGLQPVSNPPAILGGSFLKSQFVIFDYTGPRMGFAAQRK
ncbi:aspergillopepsin A [Nannizzia gypsea CBS 118893]|uniref:Aspergillopepsin A n=1 Tax=Arthroderma gypseum (strain ATCC MYA-4604 / CBS 118893) TaxID=535722 RepID=E4UT30_ARTGP|nr:aspergillopepsin A [Nannizzia gypsea CBS 118893]EFR00643.1 aspergillopepsin A [Nannizzia gypsea CBS 118893]